MGSIYLPYQKPSRWNVDRVTIAYNCARLGLPRPPVLAMPFWEGAGNKVYDYSEQQRNGVLQNQTFWKNNCLDFPGTDDYVSISKDCNIPGDQVSVLVRVMTRSIASGSTGICGNSNSSNDGYAIQFDHSQSPDAFRFAVSSDAGGYVNSSTTISANQFYDVAGVAYGNGKTLKIFLDGKEDVSVAQSQNISQSDNGFVIGRWYLDIANIDLDGQLEYVYVFPVGLNVQQVQTVRDNRYGMFEPIRSPQWVVPLDVTTAGPTTVPPTTLAPTTLPSTTLPPTTLALTTLAPTTLPSTTLAPTTAAPADIRSAQVLAQVEWVEDISTTAAPTTAAPTTLAPTTLVPTTLALTTLAPTTLAPTTEAPTTPIYTTVGPTTVHVATTPGPTTSAPTTVPSTTLAPTSLAPTTVLPTTIAPTSLAPTTIAPTTVAPTTSVPTTTLTTIVPTTAIPEEICVKTCSSPMINEILCGSPITKEITCNGNLC